MKFDPVQIARSREPFDFHDITPFNDGTIAVFRGDDLASSDWEMHPDTDELLMVLEGLVTIEILTDDTETTYPLTAGQFVVVPRGHSHRHRDVCNLIEMYYTPGETLQSTAEDPRAGE